MLLSAPAQWGQWRYQNQLSVALLVIPYTVCHFMKHTLNRSAHPYRVFIHGMQCSASLDGQGVFLFAQCCRSSRSSFTTGVLQGP